jgi:very-short-patch-repair endonuclease
MFALINSVLDDERFFGFGVAPRVPLKMIIRDVSKLTALEKQYAMNILTHVDFLIFDKLGRTPRLIVEVDGVSYHKEGTLQSEHDKMKNGILEKYGLRYIRFKTNGSGERQRLVDALNR